MLVSSIVWKEGMHKVVARPLTQYQRQWYGRYWELWPVNPISNSFWHSQNCRLATSIECYSQVYILHNLVEYALIVVMYLTIDSRFFNSWILLICGCLDWFCRPTTCKKYIAVAQPSCLSNTEFHFTARYMPKGQGSTSVLFFVGTR